MWLTAHPGLLFPFKNLQPFCVSTCSICFVGLFHLKAPEQFSHRAPISLV